MNIASGIITLVLLIASAIAWFFFLMLALNGFSERDANPAMIFFAVWGFLVAAALAAASFFLTRFLIGKSFNAVLAVALSVIAAIAVGFIADFGGLIASTIIASEVRESYRKK
ncbi:MAG TPA: hypothetical protein VIL74_25565 [Pyrinomonadaceae bacterium]|jgi:glucan phosphoethanolaminetransferase (alkaline phosphatase superfamily)